MAGFISDVKEEVEASTFWHADLGDAASKLFAVKNDAGQIAGYALVSDGADDADLWSASGIALFAPGGQLIDRSITSSGRRVP